MEALRLAHPNRIPIHVTRTTSGSTHYFIWSSEDVRVLRAKHRICGLLTGTLPLIPQQNVFLGLPLQLFYEEVSWLLTHDAAMLIDEQTAHRPALPQEVLKQHQDYIANVTIQRQEMIESRAKTRETRNLPPESQDESSIPFYHTTPASSTQPWYIPTPTFTPLPSTPKTIVFNDLHKKGYYLALGLRFGGDFTVYPGDPLRYHAHFSASVSTSPLSALELVASGRLGTAVKKSHLIAYVDGGDVAYFSLSWAGFGT